MDRRLSVFVGALLALGLSAAPPLAGSAAAQESPDKGQDAPKKAEPLTEAQIESRLRRAERNLVLHGLSLNLDHLRAAYDDYRDLFDRMTAEPPTARATEDQLFTTSFALAFSMARAPVPEISETALRKTYEEQFQEAVNRAAAINPEFPGIQVLEGMMDVGLGRLPEGLTELDKGLRRMEGVKGLRPWQTYQIEFFGRLARGEGLLDPAIGREDLALKDFERCRDLAGAAMKNPLTPQGSRLTVIVRTYLAAAYQTLAYYQKAEATLDSLMKEDPRNALHPYNRGLVSAWQQKFDDALRYYSKAVGLDRKNPSPRLKMAYILLIHPPSEAGPDAKQALRHAEAYRTLTGKETAEYCACRGEIAKARGDAAEAEKWFRRALELHPDCRHALNELIQMMGRRRTSLDAEGLDRLKELRRRLGELMRNRRGEGMESAPVDITFC
ncbi:MAG: tetratricopeptide repeat protein [Planctomycetota bacterium]